MILHKQSKETEMAKVELKNKTDILGAYERIKDYVIQTPTIKALQLSEILEANVFLKLENLQLTGSFKTRGAVNKLLKLSKEERKKGVITCSAGNHAQGVAYHCHHMKIPATIIMPENTPLKKVTNTKKWGADVVLKGQNFTEAFAEYKKIAEEKGLIKVPPFNDQDIIEGQGTVAVEMLLEHPKFDAVIVPIGGGGLISGMSAYIKAAHPEIEVIGVESEAYPSVHNAMKKTKLEFYTNTIAEGIAVKEPGDINLAYIEKHVDDFLVVSEKSIEHALYTLLSYEKLVVEGAAAAPLAALLENKERFKGKNIALVLSGGNIDQSLLASVLMRGMMNEGLYALIRFETEDKPGVLASITAALAEKKANIVEVRHNRLFKNLPLKTAEMDITVETRGKEHLNEIKELLQNKSFIFKVITT